MKLDDAVRYVQLYGPREIPPSATTGQRGGRGGRRKPVISSQQVVIGWWQGGGVMNRTARIEGLEEDRVVFRDTQRRRWACPAADVIYVRRWPEN